MVVNAGLRPLTPAVVIVDSRNVWGSARAVFGVGRRVDVQGVCDALRPYGFDVREVHVAIGTEGSDRSSSTRLSSALKQNRDYAAKIEADRRGHVLRGRLVERSRDLEEKLVDVLCAIQIARVAHNIAAGRNDARAIIVLSEDMDLIPAYTFAQDLTVPVFAASHATVDTRGECGWLLLPEGPWRSACGRPYGRHTGRELRRFIATMCSRNTPVRMSFTAHAHDKRQDSLFLRHNSGAQAIWRRPPATASRSVGDKHELYVNGLELDESERAFPVLEVSNIPGVESRFEHGSVVRWRTATRVEVSIPGTGNRTLTAPIASLLPDDEVLVQGYERRGQPAWRLVGPLGSRAPSPGWADPTTPALARALTSASSAGSRVRAVLMDAPVDAPGQLILQPPAQDAAKAGDAYAVVHVGTVLAPSGPQALAVAVSSRLP